MFSFYEALRRFKKGMKMGAYIIVFCMVIVGFSGCSMPLVNTDTSNENVEEGSAGDTVDSASSTEDSADIDSSAEEAGEEAGDSEAAEGEGSEEGEEATSGKISFRPHYVDSTKPSNMIASTAIERNGQIISEADIREENKTKSWKEKIRFGSAKKYSSIEGIVTFRGNNFRSDPVYGRQHLDGKLKKTWSKHTGSMTANGAYWSGSGWTGQPLIVRWPEETKQIMNMHDWAKEKQGLVEVIYACMDGNIYFLDLETGEETRDTLHLGYVFKGAGALDPRGYPIMYVGAGYNGEAGNAHAFIISLVDCKILYEFGDGDSFALRNLPFFDSSALVDAETDTLIYPGENGVLYLIKLNTKYNVRRGRLSIDPEVTKWRYSGKRSSTASYWLGMEDSAATYGGYLYIADNGGHLMCLNLNTLNLMWVQDILDDTNSTPVLSVENRKLYLYISTSFHYGWRSTSTVDIPIWKIDAETGEIIWHKDYECSTIKDVSGGVQSTIAVGKGQLIDNIYVTVSRTGGTAYGVCACIDKATGQVKWENDSEYTWSSPVCVYNSNGNGRVIYFTSGGNMFVMNGKNGRVVQKLNVSGGNMEASPAVFENTLVIGARACEIMGITFGN